MIAYATRTGTRRNLDALRAAEWRLLICAGGRVEPLTEPWQYALDNGAWSAFAQGKPFDVRAFEFALRRFGAKADWTVLPDIVAGGAPSLEMSLKWMRTVLNESPRALLAVQNGITPEDVRPFLGPRVGIFVGGDTAWKLGTLSDWGHLAAQVGCWLHVGRVNTARRIFSCARAEATSFDGTSASRYAVTLPRLDNARRQLSLLSFKGAP